jgi:hypothetical protein
MTPEIALVLGILALAVVLFVTERLSVDLQPCWFWQMALTGRSRLPALSAFSHCGYGLGDVRNHGALSRTGIRMVIKFCVWLEPAKSNLLP